VVAEIPARLTLRPFHEADMDEVCGICRRWLFAQWVVVSIGWHVVAKIPACSRCVGTIEQAHTETTHAAKPATVGGAS
jgi:hypothetical protein